MIGKIAIVGLVAGLALAPYPVPAPKPLPDTAYLTAHQMVAVDGTRRLNLFCLGHGSPTVLFDAGWGESTLSWRQVQGEIARTTRACAYDRAGYGFSDPRTQPMTAQASVADIHGLLKAAHIQTPVLYVGESIAGLYGVLLQGVHPGDVAGAVLVDPAFGGQFQAMTGDLPQAVREGAARLYRGQLEQLKACAAAQAPLPKACLSSPGGNALTPKLAALERAQVSRASYLATKASEFESFLPGDAVNPDQRALATYPAHFGDKPLIILTHANMTYPGVSAAQNARIEKAWRSGHKRLAALSTRGTNRIVPGSGHYIQRDQPQAVIAAINRAIAQLRAGQG